MTPRNDDEQHLRLLAIFHYVVAAIAALLALLPLLYLVVGWFVLHAPPPKQGEPPPAIVGWVFVGFGLAAFLIGQFFAACVFAAGRCIRSRKAYWFVFVIACLQCGFFPFGTALGVFTIVVLSRRSIKEMFGVIAHEQT